MESRIGVVKQGASGARVLLMERVGRFEIRCGGNAGEILSSVEGGYRPQACGEERAFAEDTRHAGDGKEPPARRCDFPLPERPAAPAHP